MEQGREYHRSKIDTWEQSDQRAVSISRYYGMPGGCVRGDKCFYAHDEQTFQTSPRNFSPRLNSAVPSVRLGKMNTSSLEDLKKKVFVGGLSLSVESDDLKDVFEEKFGPVVDAVVIVTNCGDQILSRGFGFVTFKHEESVLSAVQAHYIILCGRKVEIKSAIPRLGLSQLETAQGNSNGALSRQVSERAEEASEGNTRNNSSSEGSNSSSEESSSCSEWSSTSSSLARGYQGSDDEPSRSTTPTGRCSSQIQWVSRFKEWLPKFLIDVSKRLKEGEWYPLSSLKGDFRATCGLELDHEAIGYQKLNDFVKSLPNLCKLRIVPVGRGSATHMVLIPGAVKVKTVGSQQVKELHRQMKSPMAGHSYAAATCNGTASCETTNLDCAVSSANIGPQLRAIHKHFDDHSVSMASEFWVQNMHFAESNGKEITRDHAFQAQVSANQNGAHRRALFSPSQHGAAMRTPVSARKSGAGAFLQPLDLNLCRQNRFKQNGRLRPAAECGNGSGRTPHLNGIRNGVSLQGTTSHGFQKMKSGIRGHSELIKNLAVLVKDAPDRSHTARSEVGMSEIHDDSLLCMNQVLAPVCSLTTKPFTDNATEEPGTPVNQVTLTPFSTYDTQVTSLLTRESSASSSYNIWAHKVFTPRSNVVIRSGQEGMGVRFANDNVQKSTHSFQFSYEEGEGKERVQDVFHAVSSENGEGKEMVEDVDHAVSKEIGNHFPEVCGFCSYQPCIWIALPCKHYGICSPCKNLLYYEFPGGGYASLCTCPVRGCSVERWVRVES